MEVRKFSLINSNKETCDFMLDEDEESLISNFLHSPTGLGINRNDSFLRLGDKFIRTNKQISQPAPSGSIAFIGNSNNEVYQKYHSFVKFISKEPLKLIYKPENINYTMDVVVSNLEKSEINEQGYLDCSIRFSGLTPWYKMVKLDYKDGSGLVPSESLHPSGSLVPRNQTNGRIMEYFNEGTLEAKTRLIIYGPIKNPQWEFWDSLGVSSGLVNVELTSSQVLVVDCITTPYKIYRIPTSEVSKIYDNPNLEMINALADMYDSSDFSTKRFVTFLPNTNNYFQILNPQTEVINKPTRIVLDIMESYESV